MGAHGRARRPEVGRAAGRPPRSSAPTPSRAGRRVARLGGGHRARDAVRAADRHRPHGPVRPDRPGALARAVHPPALVEGEWRGRHEFLDANRALVEEVEALEHRSRRRDILVDDEALFAFYAARVPDDVVSAAHFDRWWRDARREDPARLTFTRELLMDAAAAEAMDPRDWPETWKQGDLELRLSYRFEPGASRRRRHRPRAAGGARRSAARSLRVARARAARGAGHDAAALAAQGAAAAAGAGAGDRRGGAGGRCGRAGGRCSRTWPSRSSACAACGAGRRVRPRPAAAAPARDVPWSRTASAACSRPASTLARVREAGAPAAARRADGGVGAAGAARRAVMGFGTLPQTVTLPGTGVGRDRLPGAGRRGRDRRRAGA